MSYVCSPDHGWVWWESHFSHSILTQRRACFVTTWGASRRSRVVRHVIPAGTLLRSCLHNGRHHLYFSFKQGRCEGTTPSRTWPAVVAGLEASSVLVTSQLILTESFRGSPPGSAVMHSGWVYSLECSVTVTYTWKLVRAPMGLRLGYCWPPAISSARYLYLTTGSHCAQIAGLFLPGYQARAPALTSALCCNVGRGASPFRHL